MAKQMKEKIISVGTKKLTIDEVIRVARNSTKIKIAPDAEPLLRNSSKWVETYVEDAIKEGKKIGKAIDKLEDELEQLKKSEAIDIQAIRKKRGSLQKKRLEMKRKMMYGVTTGFGALKGVRCEDTKAAKKIQENIILSHACGVGPIFDEETTRAVMLIRANTLASGYCGVRLELVERLRDMLNHNILPMIPEQGSVGASGDLAPLAHLALGLIGKGPVRSRVVGNVGALIVKENPSAVFLGEKPRSELRVEPTFDLTYKEGLALVNGISVITGIGVLAYQDASTLVDWADATGALTLESLKGSSRAFDKIVLKKAYKRYVGARKSADNVRKMIIGSKLINSDEHVHDPYSVRCIPQVHGAVRDLLDFVRNTLENHLEAIDDDPIIFTREEISEQDMSPMDTWNERLHFEQGNFHGEPLAFAMDLLAMALCEIGNISERRIQLILDPNHNRDLPAFLVDNDGKASGYKGVNSGYMIAQYTAASLVSENKILSHPASVDSIPTSANSEDHVSMGTIAARKARRVLENVKSILAIELLCATEALSYRTGEQTLNNPVKQIMVQSTGRMGDGTQRIYSEVRGSDGIPFLEGDDKELYTFINAAKRVLDESAFR